MTYSLLTGYQGPLLPSHPDGEEARPWTCIYSHRDHVSARYGVETTGAAGTVVALACAHHLPVALSHADTGRDGITKATVYVSLTGYWRIPAPVLGANVDVKG